MSSRLGKNSQRSWYPRTRAAIGGEGINWLPSVVRRQITKRIPERNHDWRADGVCERHLQVSAVLNLSTKLAKLIGHGIHDFSAHVGKSDARAFVKDSRIAQVQELPSNHDEVPASRRLHLNINLKWVRAIKHLPCASACRSSSFESRLKKAVEEKFDAARSLSLTRQPGFRKRGLGESHGVLRRLVVRFRSRRFPNFLPQRNCLSTAFAALLEVALHQLLLVGFHSLIHEIDPPLDRKG